jgi:hypothetical protein
MSKLKTDFLTKENVELLWEIILDDEGIKRIHDINNPNFQNFFINQLRGFQHSGIQDLINMNKMFITNIIDIATTSVKERPREKEKELITYENIQTDRQTKFDNEYKQKAFEFQDAIKLVVPEQLDFTEKKDIPITEMERLISETIAQRNFDINKILKDVPPPPLNQPKQQNHNQIKYIKIDKNNLNINNEVIDLQQKKVSWNNEVEEIEIDEEKVPNIFSKLKLIPQKVENNIDEVPNELSETIKKLDSLTTSVAKILNILEKLNKNNIII